MQRGERRVARLARLARARRAPRAPGRRRRRARARGRSGSTSTPSKSCRTTPNGKSRSSSPPRRGQHERALLGGLARAPPASRRLLPMPAGPSISACRPSPASASRTSPASCCELPLALDEHRCGRRQAGRGAVDDIGAMVRPSLVSRERTSLRGNRRHDHVVAVVPGHRVERAAAGHEHEPRRARAASRCSSAAAAFGIVRTDVTR